MTKHNNSIIEEIYSKIDIVGYYSSYISKWESKKTNNWNAICPFHSEKNGSFYVEIKSGKWICMGKCDTGGDIIAFHMKMHNCDFKKALKDLAEIAGIENFDLEDNEDENDIEKVYKELNLGEDEKNDNDIKSTNNEQEKNTITDNNNNDTKPEAPKKNTKKSKSKEKLLELGKKLLTEENLSKFISNFPEDEVEYFKNRGINKEIINKYEIGYREDKKCIVFPIRRNSKLFTFKFYKKKTEFKEKRIWQIPEDYLGYKPLWVFPEPDKDKNEIYLFEGEMDSLLALSFGLNATTITGGAGSWREELHQYFKDKIVYVCYDSDQKGKIGSRKVCNEIAKFAEKVFKVNLKLKEEKSKDFGDYIVKEKNTIENFKELCKIANQVVHVDNSKILDEDGCYYRITENKKSETEFVKISNFTVKLLCRYIRDNSMSREVILIDEKGKASRSVYLEPEMMSSIIKFKSFCFSCGDYSFEGTPNDLDEIFKLVSAQDPDAKEIYQIYQVGYIKHSKIWIFSNVAIKEDKDGNKIIYPDERGVFWDDRTGYTPIPVDSLQKDSPRKLPTLETESKYDGYEISKDFCKKLIESVGSLDILAGVCLSAGSIYSRDIISDNSLGVYPIALIYGQKGSGKTELGAALVRMWGLDKSDAENLPGITSQVPISRKLAYYSNIPTWWDEFRETNQNTEKIIGYLRGAYDGIGRSLGIKGTIGMVNEPIRSTVIISGEHLPADEAFRSRTIAIPMKKGGKDIEIHQDVIVSSYRMSYHIFKLIHNKNNKSKENLIKKILEYKKILNNAYSHLDERTIKNYSIVLGLYNVLIDPDDKIYTDYIINGDGINLIDKEVSDCDEKYESQLLSDFIDIVQYGIEKGEMNGYAWYHVKKDSDKVFIWMRPLYDFYAKEFAQTKRDSAPGLNTIINHFKELNCYIESNAQHKMPKNKNDLVSNTINKKCLVLKFSNLNEKIKGWINE
jgi:hypothetical protein